MFNYRKMRISRRVSTFVLWLAVACLATLLFLGGWQGPFVKQWPWLGVLYFLGNVIFFLLYYKWRGGPLPPLPGR